MNEGRMLTLKLVEDSRTYRRAPDLEVRTLKLGSRTVARRSTIGPVRVQSAPGSRPSYLDRVLLLCERLRDSEARRHRGSLKREPGTRNLGSRAHSAAGSAGFAGSVGCCDMAPTEKQ